MNVAELPLADRVRKLFQGDADILADPFPTWNELRREHPVLRLDDTVVLSTHADVKELLGDNNVLYSRAATKHSDRYERARQDFSARGREAFDSVLDQEFLQLVRLDPPEHPRLKKIVQPPFAVRTLKTEMESRVRQRVTEGLDELDAAAGSVDFKRFAFSLPLIVLGDLLGIPFTDLDQIHSWAKRIAENKFNADSEDAAVEAERAYDGLLGYIDELLIAQEQGDRRTGIIEALLGAEAAGTIDRAGSRAMVALMIFAGHETTSNLLSIGMLSLLRQRDQWETLVAEPDLAAAAVEELTRFVTPAHFLPYVAAQDRMLGGVQICAGDSVIGVLAAANRDPGVFNAPDVLDIRRRESRLHVGFGMGPHSCLGAGLARMEAVTLFRQMAERFPGVSLDPDQSMIWGGRSLRTPGSMLLRLRPAQDA
ncbi:cytochrome P450 [Nakamurella sp. YIM 132087]|uniref:Cytochrome P450 n=1 Tax=Nakamurella alba TaxID=2665158 RepID=A0A7K1FE82_9ACTN|nr:cytochrome P450 [Nakamurella alba]MTD12407.1 cytochrome P450 [Nakamurella alba]